MRLGLYRRLSSLSSKVELEGFAAELIDRFGNLPKEVNTLLLVVRIKAVCKKAGIAKLEIRRKVNKLEFLIHAARPKAIAVGDDEEYTFVKLRDALNKLLDKPRHIRIKVIQITKAETESTLIARSLADQLEKRVAFKRAIRQVAQRLEKAGVKGFKLQISGRLNGAEMARAEWAREGRVPLQTLRADISYATDRAYTTYGVLGIKVWIFNKEII